MRAHALNAARRLGTTHGHDPRASDYTPRSCTQEPLRRRYWAARERAEREGTILVWNDFQRMPASLYAAKNMPRARIMVDRDPGIRNDPRRGIVRYHSG